MHCLFSSGQGAKERVCSVTSEAWSIHSRAQHPEQAQAERAHTAASSTQQQAAAGAAAAAAAAAAAVRLPVAVPAGMSLAAREIISISPSM